MARPTTRRTSASHSWFVADKEGLAQLQRGKPLHYIAREPVANAFDQKASFCRVEIRHDGARSIEITVEDDDPEGFKDLADSYTLFKATQKRADPTVRGRFSAGEKQAISRCSFARITTTKGTMTFDEDGRHAGRKKRPAGSQVFLKFRGTKQDALDIQDVLLTYIPPSGIRYTVNNVHRPTPRPAFIIEAFLQTELYDAASTSFRRTTRKAKIHLHQANGPALLYELGIPVVKSTASGASTSNRRFP